MAQLEKGEAPRNDGDYRDQENRTVIYYADKASAIADLKRNNAVGCTGPNSETMGPSQSDKYPPWWYVTYWK